MKKIILIITALCLALALGACARTQNLPTAEPSPIRDVDAVLFAKIISVSDDSLLICGRATGDGAGALYTVGVNGAELLGESGEAIDKSDLKAGMAIEVGYSGEVQESYPAQPVGVTVIMATAQEDDLTGLYLSVVRDLYDTDPGLNADIELLAFDLTGLTNLSAAEKSALLYLVGREYPELNLREGTFDELCDEGLIDRDNLYFETGLLFTLSVKDAAGEGFSFDAEKWRGGLGAYFFTDCKATGSGDEMSYTVGAHAVA